MNEINILRLFYDEMTLRSATRDKVFLNMDKQAVKALMIKYGVTTTLEELHRLTDICIANEWLERTTADPGYNFLSLTKAGLQIVLTNYYLKKNN